MFVGDKFNLDALIQTLDTRDLPVFNLGILLRDGTSLIQALRQVAMNSQNRKIKTSAAGLPNCLPPEIRVRRFLPVQRPGFPPHARFILASPLEDQLKGHL